MVFRIIRQKTRYGKPYKEDWESIVIESECVQTCGILKITSIDWEVKEGKNIDFEIEFFSKWHWRRKHDTGITINYEQARIIRDFLSAKLKKSEVQLTQDKTITVNGSEKGTVTKITTTNPTVGPIKKKKKDTYSPLKGFLKWLFVILLSLGGSALLAYLIIKTSGGPF